MKTIVICSGGLDSVSLAHKVAAEHTLHSLVSFDYGQRHKKELDYAAACAVRLNVPHKIIDIRAIGESLTGSALTDDIDVPDGHYEEESMKSTVVPNRNMVMLSLAIAYAVSVNASAVLFGAHGGDHAIYPDCRPEFVEKMAAVSRVANYEIVDVQAPYLSLNKIEILAKGIAMGLDYGKSWTCYKGRELACGKCGSCQERLEAFSLNDAVDPLKYEGQG